MEFPKIFDRNKWSIPKDKNRVNYWHQLKNGVTKLIGLRTVYERDGRKNEAVVELNLFKKGAVIQMWFSGVGGKNEKVQSRIMKNGCWVYGAPNEKVSIDGLVSGGLERFRGIRVQIESVSGEIVTVDFYKPGLEPKPGEFPD